MPDEIKDAKETVNEDINSIAAGGSSTPDHPHVKPDSENIYSTIEDDTPGPSPSQDDKKGIEAGDPEAAKKADETKSAEEAAAREKEDVERFDKHPRFQQLLKDRDDSRKESGELREKLARIEGHLEALGKQPREDKRREPEYVDITTKTEEDLREWQERDPKGYAANLYSQMRSELRQELEQREQTTSINSSVKKTFDGYAEKNPDFMPMWNSGELQKFMSANPGHNAISAHLIMTAEKRGGETQKQMDDRIAKAVKEAEEKVTKNFQAKKQASKVLAGGGAPPPNQEDNEIQDTKSRGGIVNVIADRIKKMRGATA